MARILIYAVVAVIAAGVAAGVVLMFMQEPSYDYNVPLGEIRFKDSPEPGDPPDVNIANLDFVDADGGKVALRELLGDQHLIVVITRGNTTKVCPYCATQTSRLISNYGKFAERNAEVVVIYPVERQEDSPALEKFLDATREQLSGPTSSIPFPLVLDVGLDAVDQLGLRAMLSKPATYVLDKHGQVRFAYVGKTVADRPSVDALLEQLDKLADTPDAVSRTQPRID